MKATIRLALIAVLAAPACGKKDNKNGGGGPGGDMGGGGGGGPQAEGLVDASTVNADLTSASGVLILDSTGGAGLTEGGGGGGGGKGEDSLQKIKPDGSLAPIFTVTKPETKQCCGGQSDLPKIMTIAISPLNEVYLHFERPFIYKSQTQPRYLPRPECQNKNGPQPQQCFQPGEDNPEWRDPWDMANGFQCQIFKVKGGNVGVLKSTSVDPTASNLECLDDQHFIDSWQASRSSVFQFDDLGNVYYPGSTPNMGGRMVVYRRSPDGQITEMINSNICVQDFLVTRAGGVFYTGSSSCGPGAGGGTGFFRYVKAGGGLREIARDWWNFVFEPVVGAAGDEAVFFGPNPKSSTTASWDSACLFHYTPPVDQSDAVLTPVITCGSDINSWIDMRRQEDVDAYGQGFDGPTRNPSQGWRDEFVSRCTSAGQVFAGGGSQISSIKQDSTGKVYVIGQVRKKKKGAVSCNVQVKGVHCADKDGAPHLTSEAAYATEALCTAAGGTWVTGSDGECMVQMTDSSRYTLWERNSSREACLTTAVGDSVVTTLAGNQGKTASKVVWVYHRQNDYNNVVSPICTASDGNRDTQIWDWQRTSESSTTDGSTITDAAAKYNSDWWRCMPVDDNGKVLTNSANWLDEYKGLAEVNSTTKTLSLLSALDEQAIKLWLIDDVPYYSAYNTQQGKYLLKRWDADQGQPVTVAEDFETYNLSRSASVDKLYYDGLNFKTNEYSFGTIDKATNTRTTTPGLTGQVKTILVLPD